MEVGVSTYHSMTASELHFPPHMQMATDHPYLGQLWFRVKQKIVTEGKNESKAFSATLVAKAETR